MHYQKLFFLIAIISFTSFSQIKSYNSDTNPKQNFKVYLKFGFGRIRDNINFGGGLFFPLSEKFMIGIRGNVNSEIDIFKIPTEILLDMNLSVRHIPAIWNNLVVMIGGGIGYARGVKRGNLISRPLLIVEEYERIQFKSMSGLIELETSYFLNKFIGVSIAGYSVFTSKKNITTYQVSLFLYGLSSP